MSYNGWRLDAKYKNALMERFPPVYPDVIAHHITLKLNAQFLPDAVDARVIGYTNDGAGVEALVVKIDGTEIRQDKKVYHVTWSIDREAGFKPHSSNAAIATIGWTAIEPIAISVTPFYVDHDKNEHTMETIAKQRCRDEGYEDVDFVGTKGYPNWHDFTDAAIKRVRDMVEAIKREV